MMDHGLSRNSERTANPTPAMKKHHQHPVPKWYSALITIGWKTPIVRKVARPTMIPSKFMIISVQIFSRTGKDNQNYDYICRL